MFLSSAQLLLFLSLARLTCVFLTDHLCQCQLHVRTTTQQDGTNDFPSTNIFRTLTEQDLAEQKRTVRKQPGHGQGNIIPSC